MERRVVAGLSVFARIALGIGFLSAVADRFGLWGPHGHANVAWGDLAHFFAYTHSLLPFLPQKAAVFSGWMATIAESVLGVLLLLGFHTQKVSFCSGLLLLTFGMAMASSSGPEAPLNYSVFSAAATGLLLSVQQADPFTLDKLTRSRRPAA